MEDKELRPPDAENPFKYWLQTKIKYHLKRDEISFSDLNEPMRRIVD